MVQVPPAALAGDVTVAAARPRLAKRPARARDLILRGRESERRERIGRGMGNDSGGSRGSIVAAVRVESYDAPASDCWTLDLALK
jgi:hypothetical protein